VIWILWHRRLGDLNQMQVLAQALARPFVVKKLKFRKPHYAPLARLADGTDQITPPWPDMILCAEALTSVIARRLKKLSGGKIKIISLARPSGDVRNFDLVLTTAQYRLPKLPHVVELVLPLTSAAPMIATSKSKKLTLLVGASSAPEELDGPVAAQMLKELQVYAGRNALALNIVTSPRTESVVTTVLKDMVQAPHQVFFWEAGGENHFQRCIAEADEIVVTSDSVSMLADGLVAGKLVYVYKLPRSTSVLQDAVEWIFRRWPQNYIFRTGIVEPSTDRWLLVEKLIKAGHVNWFGDVPRQHSPFDPQADLDLAVAAIKRLG
jgi:uncharacterized protein